MDRYKLIALFFALCSAGFGQYPSFSSGPGRPGGSTTQLQYNNAGAFGGTTGLTWGSRGADVTTGISIASGTTSPGTNGAGYIKILTDLSSPTPIAITGTTTANALGASGNLVGVGTSFITEVKALDCINLSSGGSALVTDVSDDTNLTIATNWCGGATIGNGASQTMTISPSPFSIASFSNGQVFQGLDVFGDAMYLAGSNSNNVYLMGSDVLGFFAFQERFFSTNGTFRWQTFRGKDGWMIGTTQNNPATGIAFKVDTTNQLVTSGYPILNASVAFASIGTPANGTMLYCSDCTVTSGIDDTCAAAGSGAMANRVNGAWKCRI